MICSRGWRRSTQWPDKVRLMQENWIGKSRGLQFRFRLAEPVAGIDGVEVFTTRPDTIFGASFVAVAAGSSDRAGGRGGAIPRRRSSSPNAGPAAPAPLRSRRPRRGDSTPGSRSFIRSIPIGGLPVYIANFVLMDYGTGAIFGVPGHDQRDFEFAKQYQLPIRRVVAAGDRACFGTRSASEAENAPGVAVNSRFLDGLTTEQAAAEVIRRAEEAGWGKGTTASTASATGACRASATGARRSRSSTAMHAGPFPFPPTSFR